VHREGHASRSIYGKVIYASGKGIPNASVEIWQTDEDGAYDLQKGAGAPSAVPEMDMRGRFRADANGNYYMRTWCRSATASRWTAPWATCSARRSDMATVRRILTS
jgi:protocatechuate 3,4-dioxygenase beta subunit